MTFIMQQHNNSYLWIVSCRLKNLMYKIGNNITTEWFDILFFLDVKLYATDLQSSVKALTIFSVSLPVYKIQRELTGHRYVKFLLHLYSRRISF